MGDGLSVIADAEKLFVTKNDNSLHLSFSFIDCVN